jgi:hypothetical protein
MKKLLALVTAFVLLGTGVAVAHQPVVLLNSDTTAAKGPLLVDGTVSFAIRAAFNKAGEKKAFRAQFKEGDALSVQYLIVNKKPENSLKSTQLPTVVVTGPGGFKVTMKINERTNFYEPYTGTNYLYLARFSAAAKAGIYSFVITAKTKSSITLGVGDRETRGEVVRGPYVAPTPTVTPSPTPTATPSPTPTVTPSPTPTATPSPTPTVTPSPTPTVTPSPTPPVVVDVSVRDLALKEVKQRWTENVNNKGLVTLYVQPELPEFVSKAVINSADNAMRLFGKEYLPDATLFAGTKSDWYTKIYCEHKYSSEVQSDCLLGKFGGPGGGSGWPQEFPAVDASGAVYGPIHKNNSTEYLPSPAYVYLSSYKDKTLLTASVHSSPAHELFHALQAHQFGGGATTAQSATNTATKLVSLDCSNNLMQCPSLWVEGAAFYFGYAAAEMTNPNLLNTQGLPINPSWITGERFTLDKVMKFSVNDMMKSPEIGNYVYFSGAIMTELLVAEFGIKKVLEFTKNSAAGLTDTSYNFAKNFKATFGIDWTAWSPKADIHLQNTLSGKVTLAKDLNISEVRPTANSTPSPTSTLTVAQMWNETGSRAIEGYVNAFPLKPAQFTDLETIWRISDAVSPIISEEIQKQYKESINFWSAYTKFGNPLQIIVGNLDDLDFVCKWRNTYLEMQHTSCATDFRQDKTRAWDAHTTQVANRATDFYFMSDPKTLKDPSFWPRVPHEFFHNVQFAQSPRYKFVLPCWAEEGGAEFFGIMIASQGALEKFLSMRVNLIKDRNGRIKQSQLVLSDWKAWLLAADMTSYADGKSGWGCESASMEGIYSYGFMATEYLNLKLGTTGLLALYRDAGVLGWDKAIEKAFDKSKSDAYDEIALFMKQEHDIGIKQKVFS